MRALAGKVPGGLPSLSISRLSGDGSVQLVSAAFVIALVAFPDGTLRDAETCQHRTCDEIALIRFDAELYFANTPYFEDKPMERVALKSGLRYVIVVGDDINHVDASSEEMLTHVEAARQ